MLLKLHGDVQSVLRRTSARVHRASMPPPARYLKFLRQAAEPGPAQGSQAPARRTEPPRFPLFSPIDTQVDMAAAGCVWIAGCRRSFEPVKKTNTIKDQRA